MISADRFAATARPTRASWAPAALVGVLVLVVHGMTVLAVRNNGWDDGTITLAFSRTFADSGRIALTPVSPEVEGYSSTAWFLLMALAAKVGVTDFDALIRFSQLSAAACSAVAAALLVPLLRRYLPTSWAAVLAGATFCSMPFLDESMNGMEMALLSLVAVLACHLVARPGSAWALLALGAAASLIRLEATGYAVAAGLAVGWLAGARRSGAAMVVGAVAAAVGQTVARLAWFGSVVPNTFLAKRNPPYTYPGPKNALLSRAEAATDLLHPLGIALVVLALLLLVTRPRPVWRRVSELRREPVVVLAVAYCVAVWGVNVVIGRNWGYVSRMELSAIPLLVLVATAALTTAGVRWRNAQLALLAAALVVGSLPVLQWESLRAAQDDDLVATTPATFAETGRAVDELRRLAGADQISLLVPDVGGTALCCPDIRILDLGLLTNPDLAGPGYDGLDDFIARERPDVIETHQPWSRASGIYGSPTFLADYVPVVADGVWMWVRTDVAAQLPGTTADAEDLTDARYRGVAFDEQFIAERDLPVLVVDR